jgi:hypothetical protein
MDLFCFFFLCLLNWVAGVGNRKHHVSYGMGVYHTRRKSTDFRKALLWAFWIVVAATESCCCLLQDVDWTVLQSEMLYGVAGLRLGLLLMRNEKDASQSYPCCPLLALNHHRGPLM